MQTISINSGNSEGVQIRLTGNVSIQFETGATKPVTAQASLEWSQTLLDGESVDYSDAESAVAALGSGWRLPTRMELESLLDLTRHEPAIDTQKYPDTKNSSYWTSTPCAWNQAAVWVVGFYYGLVSSSTAATARVFGRCVPVSNFCFLIFTRGK